LIAMGFEAKTTGKRIADIRGKNNMSQEKLAETLSKSVAELEKIDLARIIEIERLMRKG